MAKMADSRPVSILRWAARPIAALLSDERVARGLKWLFAGAAASRVCALISSVLVARLLGLTAYGKFGMVQSTISMFQAFAAFGLGETATRYVAELRDLDRDRAGGIVALSTITAALTGFACLAALVGSAEPVSKRVLLAPELSTVLLLAAPALFFGAMNGAQLGVLAGLEEFRQSARVNTLAAAARAAVLVLLAGLYGIAGAAVGLSLAAIITWILTRLTLRPVLRRSGIKVAYRKAWRELHVLVEFSLPALLGGVLVVPVYWLCTAMLARQPNGYAELGIFNAASQWYQALLFLPQLVAQVVLPVLAHRLTNGGERQALKTLWVSIRANALFAGVLALILIACGRQIMALYGDSFSTGWLTFGLAVTTGALLAAEAPVGQYIAATGRMWIGFAMNLGWAIAFLGATTALVKYGAPGLAGSRLLAYALHATWLFGYVAILQRRRSRAALAADECLTHLPANNTDVPPTAIG